MPFIVRGAGLADRFGPYGCLHLADMGLIQQQHAQARLADASADGERQFVLHQHTVEGQVQPFFKAFLFQLADKRCFIDTDAHGG